MIRIPNRTSQTATYKTGSPNYVDVSSGAAISLQVQNLTITITGTPAFSAYAGAYFGGILLANGCTFSGSATGSRYSVSSNAVIFTNGAGANYFPGDSAGSVATGGQYI